MNMKYAYKIILIIISLCSLIQSQQEIKPLAMRPFLETPEMFDYNRGIFLIILGSSGGLNNLESSFGLNYLKYKRSQGFEVVVKTLPDDIVPGNAYITKEELRTYIGDYYSNNPMLEYVLLIGDVTGGYIIPASDEVQSYNESDDTDVTDYKYTYFEEEEVLSPHFFIGRWTARSDGDLDNMLSRTIIYSLLGNIDNVCYDDDPIICTLYDTVDPSYLTKSLVIAGNFNGEQLTPYSWPVTPQWTSAWLKEKFLQSGYDSVGAVYYTAQDTNASAQDIAEIWNEGVGFVNYRGWGNKFGWEKPEFDTDNIIYGTSPSNLSYNGSKLPIVMSFVCNTGDFEWPICFGEQLIKSGSSFSPLGAAAVIAPSDLDTDTRFNNVMCGKVWDEILEEKISELGPALHAGKQALIHEFGRNYEEPNNGNPGTTNIPEFYHHVYGILGDPSISVWTGLPKEFEYSIPPSITIPDANSISVMDENGQALQDVIGAILFGDELIAKGITDINGNLHLEFISTDAANIIDDDDELQLFLNYPQYMQKMISITYNGSGSSITDDYSYNPLIQNLDQYNIETSISNPSLYNWIEINQLGENLCLTDDSVIRIALPFYFNFYGINYDSLTVSSNGWASFENDTIPYFWNFSIPFPMGPSAMLAPFMDDLDDMGEEPFTDLNENCNYDLGEPFEDFVPIGSPGDGWDEGVDLNVYSHYDGDNFIIEWDEVANGEDDEYCPNCTYETFQLILTSTHEIIFQYKDITDIDANGNYSTIGIESPNQNYGIQYQFRNELFDGDYIVQSEMAIKFTPPHSMGVDDIISVPQSMLLYKPYPNPFNPVVNIHFDVNILNNLVINIYNLNGQKIRTLASKMFSPGEYHIIWNGRDVDGHQLPSGVYFVSIKSSEETINQKVVLLK